MEKRQLKEKIERYNLAKLTCKLFSMNEFFNGELFQSDLEYVRVHTEEDKEFSIEKIDTHIAKEGSDTTRFAYYTGQDSPENKKEFLKQSGLSKSEYTLLNKKGIIKSFFYDDGCAHATLNLKKARRVIERCVSFHELNAIEISLENDIAEANNLLDTFASMRMDIY